MVDQHGEGFNRLCFSPIPTLPVVNRLIEIGKAAGQIIREHEIRGIAGIFDAVPVDQRGQFLLEFRYGVRAGH